MVAVAIGAAAAIGGATSIISGNKSSKAIKDAASQSNETERYIYDQTRADYAPWKATGEAALGKLSAMYGMGPPGADRTGGFTESPGYQYSVDEATKAIERSASAKGYLRAPRTMKAIARDVTGLASQDYGNYQARLMALAGIGQAATGATAQAGQQYASGTTANTMNAGNARASSYANTGNAINQSVGNLASMYLYNKGYGGGSGASAPPTGTPPYQGGWV